MAFPVIIALLRSVHNSVQIIFQCYCVKKYLFVASDPAVGFSSFHFWDVLVN